jgi:hypothetical protein
MEQPKNYERSYGNHYIAAQGVNEKNEIIHFTIASNEVSMIVVAACAAEDDCVADLLNLDCEPNATVQVTLYMGGNKMVIFEVVVPITHVHLLQTQLQRWRDQSVLLHIKKWHVCRVGQ